VNAQRVLALIGKELREFRASPAAVVPVAIVSAVCIAIPGVLLVIVPRLTTESLTSDPGLVRVVNFASTLNPDLAALPLLAAVQAFMLQQFLLLFLIVPIVGAVSLAAYSVVGEKQGRTLEPLLTTPVTTTELLLAKVLAAFMPSLAMEAAGLAGYLGLVAAFADPGVVATLLTARTAVLVGLVGPLAALAALQMTIAVSSRVNDPRSAQQIAVVLVLPIAGMLIGQIAGAFIIPTWALFLISGGLLGLWGALIALSVRLFDRERILTKSS
jgi:ABC-2 type transport system permease protein